MLALTPSERRGATVIVVLLAIGAGHDLWRARHPALTRPPATWTETAGGAPGAPRETAAGTSAPIPPPAQAAQGHGPAAIVDLNRATIRDLDALPGIGPVLARRIVEHRETHGPFRSVEELLAVRGIGPRLLERLRPRVAIGPRDPGAPRR